MDRLDPEARSKLMSRVRSKNTGPELVVRKAVWRNGFRYRLHNRALPGQPDLTFPRLSIAVFVHGCFWHGHTCARGAPSKSNLRYWQEKIALNRNRDRKVEHELGRLGWTVLTVWACQLRSKERSEKTLSQLIDTLNSARTNIRHS